MKKINLGHVEIVSDPSINTPPPSDPAKVQSKATTVVVSLSDLQRSAGFMVLQPRWLPATGLKLVQAYATTIHSPSANRMLCATLKYSEGANLWLVLIQSQIDTIGKRTVPFEISEGRVGNHIAALYTHAAPAASQPDGHIMVLDAIWEQGNTLIQTQSYGLTREQLIQIGASLR